MAVRLKHVAEVIAGQSPDSADVDVLGEGLPFLQGNAEFGHETPTAKWQCDVAPKRVRAADVLVSVRAPVGAVNLADRPYGIGRGLAAVRVKSGHHKYFYWWLKASEPKLNSMATGSTFTAISASDLADLEVPVTDAKSQRAICNFLDRETAEIDAFIADQEQLIELLTERRAATISHAVTKGLDPSAPMKDSGVEWIGDIPAHWEVTKVRAAVTDINLRNDPIRSENYLSLMANIGVMLYEEKGDVGNKAPEDFSRCKLVQTGDLVINSMNYGIGSFGVSPHDGICSPVYIVLRPLQESVVAYVERIFECRPFQRLAQSFGNGILEHRRSINWGILKGMEVPKPPINEQHAIAAYLSAEVAQIDTTIADAREAIALSRERRAALISAAVTGKIDVRKHPSASPAHSEVA